MPQSTSPYAFALDQRLNNQVVLAGAGRHDAERHSERQVCLIDLKMMLARLTCSPWRMPGAHLRHSDTAECPACVKGLHCCSRAQVHMPACAHLHAVRRKRSHLPLLAQARCRAKTPQPNGETSAPPNVRPIRGSIHPLMRPRMWTRDVGSRRISRQGDEGRSLRLLPRADVLQQACEGSKLLGSGHFSAVWAVQVNGTKFAMKVRSMSKFTISASGPQAHY